jgi:nucleotide-binding universal stress UspA family protein
VKILVAVDGSACSKAAVHFLASRLAPNAGPDSSIELLNVQPPLPAYAARMAGAANVRAHHASEAKKALSPAQSILRKAGVAASSRYLLGSAGTTVSNAARGADLVVMGSHGHSSVAGLLFGSVTNTVLATCTTPLLIVRKRRPGARKPNDPLRIGVAVDGSTHSSAAVRYLLENEALFGQAAKIVLINVVPDLHLAYVPGLAEIPIPAFSIENALDIQNDAFEIALSPCRRLLKRSGVSWPEVRLAGNAGDRIAEYAQQNRLDLLVMGSHGYGALKSVALGSVATRVAARCQTPLLVIRSRQTAAGKRGRKPRARTTFSIV